MISAEVEQSKQKIKAIIEETLIEFPLMHGTVMVARGNEVLYHEGFSYPDAPFSTDKNAQYLIASVTKHFTAAALLKALYDRQVQKGHGGQSISINDTAALKGFIFNDLKKPLSAFLNKKYQIWNGRLPEWLDTVTLHQLLTHTSGIKNDQEFKRTLKFEPSTKYAYSNAGYVLIGSVIREIAREPLNTYFKRILFDPAQMDDTYLPLDGIPADLRRTSKFCNLSLGFERIITPEKTLFNSVAENIYLDKLSTAGGIVSTAEDLVKWNHALYQGQIIPMFLVEMLTIPYVQKESHLFYDGFDPLFYGYGLDIYEEGDKKYYQHCGGTAGYQSKISYNPKTNVTIVSLSNIAEEAPSIFPFINRLRNLF